MFDFILGNTVFTKTIMTCCFIGILSWSGKSILENVVGERQFYF